MTKEKGRALSTEGKYEKIRFIPRCSTHGET